MHNPIDKQKIAESFSRAATTYNQVAFVQRRTAEHLATIIRNHCSNPARLIPFLEIGAGTGIFTDLILQLGLNRGIVSDIAPAMVSTLREAYVSFPGITVECLDGERLALGMRFRSILSASTFQWFSSLRDPFLSYWHHLEPGGLLAFSMFIDGTLRELRSVTSAIGCRYPGHPLPNEHTVLAAALESGFLIEHFSVIETPAAFSDAHAFLATLKAIGSSNAAGAPLDPADLRRVIRRYDETYRNPAGVTATFRTLYVFARKLP